MSIKPVYVEAPGSKQTTIQLEMSANCTIRDINSLLCSSVCSESQGINNPHQAAYFAFLIEQLRVGIQAVRAKKDNPIQMSYSACEGVFIVTISFLSDNASFRMIAKMMADKCFLKNIKPAIQMVAAVSKDFVKEHGRDKIEDSIRTMQKNVKVFIMSKMPRNKFEGGKDAFGTKIVTQKFNDAADKIEIPSKNPIPFELIKVDTEIYTQASIGIGSLASIYQSLILAALNGQRLEYLMLNRQLRAKQKDLLNPGKELCVKFIKERLSFTREEKIKRFKDLPAEQKKKTNEKDFEAKEKSKREKKELALVQILSQSGAVPITLLNDTKDALVNHIFNINTLKKVKELLEHLVKNKK